MNETDFVTFDRAFGRVVGAFRVKLKADERAELSRTYFKLLERSPLEDVLAAGRACLQDGTTFPKIADWLAALPGGAPVDVGDLRVMGSDEAVEYLRAERLHYQDDACTCAECSRAGVTHRPLRFVPDFLDDGRTVRAFHPTKRADVVVGHWAHGSELDRWYAARDRFYAAAPAPLRRRVVALIGRPVRDREPGEEG